MALVYATKELSARTWPDFEKLFTRGNGWDFCWCMHFQRAHGMPQENSQTRSERSIINRHDKKHLVEQGRAHGILVYADGNVVGWCQYGARQELPRIDNSPNYRAHAVAEEKMWRITCFVVDKRYRRRGIAMAALKAALHSIEKKGGGMVEAYPLAPFEEIRKCEQRERGHASSFGNVSTHGTVSMFKKHGFQEVAPWGNKNVLMRRMI